MVSRPRLLAQLNEGLHRKLILISAPAGFGKTTLISEWLAAGERPAAWLSLDAGDSDPARFLTYLVAALQTIAPHIGDEVPGLLQSPQPPPPEAVLTALLNDLALLPEHPAGTIELHVDELEQSNGGADLEEVAFISLRPPICPCSFAR
jgi:LuxR family maltose regulon positive regulatory protein